MVLRGACADAELEPPVAEHVETRRSSGEYGRRGIARELNERGVACPSDEQNAAIAACVSWRNARAQPKTNLAVGSPIRTWTSCQVKAA
jgi:hypothetical protein